MANDDVIMIGMYSYLTAHETILFICRLCEYETKILFHTHPIAHESNYILHTVIFFVYLKFGMNWHSLLLPINSLISSLSAFSLS